MAENRDTINITVSGTGIASATQAASTSVTVSIPGEQGIAGATGPTGPRGLTGPTGLEGATGATGADGKFGGDTQDFLFSSSISDSGPGSGYFKFNTYSPATVTKAYFSVTGQDNAGLSQWLLSFDDYGTDSLRGRLKFTKKSDTQRFFLYNITGNVQSGSSNGIYYKVGISNVVYKTPFNINDELAVSFSPAGEKGASPPIPPVTS